MRRSFFALAVLVTLAVRAELCLAWNSTGHEVVAQIAYDQLSDAAKAKIIAVLKNHPRLKQDLLLDAGNGEDPDLAMFLRAATWPDMVRYPTNPLQHTEHHGKWHYVDYPFNLDGVVGPQPVEDWDGTSDPANLLQAMQKMLSQLKDPQTTPDRQAIDLCWVEHLVGDVHQPLHAVSLYSKEYPTGDQGGNLDVVANPGDIIVGTPSINLHSMWDDLEGLSLKPENIRAIADRIEKEEPADSVKDHLLPGDVKAWAMESFELAKSVTYLNGTLPHITRDQATAGDTPVPALPADYEKNAKAIADQRIGLAGYRLAAMLEEIAKGL